MSWQEVLNNGIDAAFQFGLWWLGFRAAATWLAHRQGMEAIDVTKKRF